MHSRISPSLLARGCALSDSGDQSSDSLEIGVVVHGVVFPDSIEHSRMNDHPRRPESHPDSANKGSKALD